MFDSYIEALKKNISSENESRFHAIQLLELHKEVIKRKRPLIVELGLIADKVPKYFLMQFKKRKELH